MEITYREIQPQDMGAIFDVRVKTWHNPDGEKEMAGMGITHEAVLEKMQSSYYGWLAEQNHKVIGFVMGNCKTGEVWVIAVLKEFENKGIGKALMNLVEGWLVSKGCVELWLTTDQDENLRAVGFYRALGWEDWKVEDGDRFMKKRCDQSIDQVTLS